MNEVKTKTVSRINKVDIVIIENGEKRIAIKPICEALGVASNGQIEKIKVDPILASVGKTILSTGSDNKQYEMFTIPFKYVFGWLFQIDSRKVKEESKESVLRFQKECYDALYNHFTLAKEYLEYKQKVVDIKLDNIDVVNSNFNNAKNDLRNAKDDLRSFRKNYSEEDFSAHRSQGLLFDDEALKGEQKEDLEK